MQDLDSRTEATFISARHSTSLQDEVWDNFLISTPQGEYTQSSAWADYKSIDGWQCYRVTLARKGNIVGGFQLLWRKSRFGRIGYISKGPVLSREDEQMAALIKDMILETACKIKLNALILQPPGQNRIFSKKLKAKTFLPERLMEIITATLVVDVSRGMTSVNAQFKRTRRQSIKKALRAGIYVRQGDHKDIAIFFGLMKETCRRQKTDPNPSTEEALVKLWEAAYKASINCRLTLAEYNGRVIAGLFCIPFGKTVTLWKKGTLPAFLYLHPMDLLYHEAFSWASSQGYWQCDFASLNRNIAEDLIQGYLVFEKYKKSRDIYNLTFGGKPMLFPHAHIYFPNPRFAIAYKLLTSNRYMTNLLKKAASGMSN